MFNKNYNSVTAALTSLLLILGTTAFATDSQQLNNAQEHFAAANSALESANQTKIDASQSLLDANKVRKEIIAIRAQIRKSKNAEEKKKLSNSADELTEKLKTLQSQGGTLREEKKALDKKALNYFEQGFVNAWGEKIRNRSPILMGDSTTLFFAHNTTFRSVHPNMLNKMGSASENRPKPKTSEEMSLLVPSLAGQNAPPELDISSFQLSREQQYFSHIEVKSDTGDSDSTAYLVPPNTIHKWLLMLSDLNGNAIENATIDILGHMPGHVHGLPTQPRVTKELSPGIYLVEGVKFQMKGWWVMQFDITSAKAKKDSIVFNLVL